MPPTRSGRSLLQTHHSTRRFPPTGVCLVCGTRPPRGGSSYAVKSPPSCKFPSPRVLNLYFRLGGAITVNWDFLLLRIAIALGILILLHLSQRFWYRALWRVTSHWGRGLLRVGVRLT